MSSFRFSARKTFMQLIKITLLAICLPTIACAAPDLEFFRQKYQLPALGVTTIQAGVVKSEIRGVRKWDDSTPAMVDDEFHLGSCTKAMTATLLAIYVQRGMLSWQTTLSEIFPEYKDTMRDEFKNVTIEQLTAHMGGISGDANSFNNGKLWLRLQNPKLNPRRGRKIVAKVVLSTKPEAPPGTTLIYSNFNYMIVGAILEKTANMAWEDLMRKEIFQPLNMTSCGFGAAGTVSLPPDQPWGHVRIDSDTYPIAPDFNGDNPPTLGPAGTVHCSMQDWTKFLQMHIDGFNGKSSPILNADGFVKLHKRYPGQEFTYGGWIRFKGAKDIGTMLTFAGSNTYSLVNVWLAPKIQYGVLSVTNLGNDEAYTATDEVNNAYMINSFKAV